MDLVPLRAGADPLSEPCSPSRNNTRPRGISRGLGFYSPVVFLTLYEHFLSRGPLAGLLFFLTAVSVGVAYGHYLLREALHV